MIPILIGLVATTVVMSEKPIVFETKERQPKSPITVNEETVSANYVRNRMAKTGRKIRKAGD